MFAVLLLLLVSGLVEVDGRSSGAPIATCESMTPGHGAQAEGNIPHRINLSTNYYKGKGSIKITISSVNPDEKFKGILLQARKADGSDTTSYGKFQVDVSQNLRTMSCGSGASNAITHSDSTEKKGAEVMWIPPNEDVGKIGFM